MTNHESPARHHPQEEYVGPATVVAGEQRIEVTANLRGRFEPIDGRFHWYGRVSADRGLDDLGSGATVTLVTEHGSAPARLNDLDPWGRPRVSGVGAPPF